MFKKATKEQAKLRLAIYAPSGGGKTFTALRIAAGIGGTCALIDSERESASKYADRFEFDSCNLSDKSTEGYIVAIKGAAAYNILVIDSLSHAWLDLVQEVDQLAQTAFRGSKFNAWSKGTPKQQALVDAILDFPGHIIATMRAKTEWAQEEHNGKKTPQRVGMAPQQGKGIEYEFDCLMSLTTDHIATIEKDRSGKFQGQIIDKPGEEFGKEMAAWLGQGAPALSLADQLGVALAGHEVAASAFLLKVGWIGDRQSYRDVQPDKAKSILARTAEFIAKVSAQ